MPVQYWGNLSFDFLYTLHLTCLCAYLCSFMYPEKLLSQHFWTPTLRDQVRASVNNSKKSSFEVLLCKLEEGTGLTGLKDELAFIPGMIECVGYCVCVCVCDT